MIVITSYFQKNTILLHNSDDDALQIVLISFTL
jgi:hypothetical protein